MASHKYIRLKTADQLVSGGVLASKSSTYQVECFLGKGISGTVVKCMRMDDKATVAIKMIQNKGPCSKHAREEVAILKRLKSLDPDKCGIVRWYQVFTDRGLICLEFEYLDKSLFNFMRERQFQPLPLKDIRLIVQQVANALSHLKAAGIIHADLKLDNMMLVNQEQEPYRIKVIDFGLAHTAPAASAGTYIQTRPYRSPEILLGLSYTEAIDMWSLGCIVAFMFLGTTLYPGGSEYDMVRYIIETQGQPPDNMLSTGCRTCQFFLKTINSATTAWELKSPEQFQKETGTQPKESRRVKLNSLDDLLHIRSVCSPNYADQVIERKYVKTFVNMLKGMLQLDAAKRITPRQLLEHQFISTRHIIDIYPRTQYVKIIFKSATSKSGKTVAKSVQQPRDMSASPVLPRCSSPPLGAGTRAARSGGSEIERAVADVASDIIAAATAAALQCQETISGLQARSDESRGGFPKSSADPSRKRKRAPGADRESGGDRKSEELSPASCEVAAGENADAREAIQAE